MKETQQNFLNTVTLETGTLKSVEAESATREEQVVQGQQFVAEQMGDVVTPTSATGRGGVLAKGSGEMGNRSALQPY